MGIPIVFSKKYTVPGCGHVFKAGKFEAALKLLLKEKTAAVADIVRPRRPSREDLELAHTGAWVEKVLSGKLTAADAARAELKITKKVLEAHLMSVGGTILAACQALRAGLGVNCGGGAHHAFADHGEGFCLLNDLAVAVNKLRGLKKIKRALVIDLDVHQGNGTASIFRGDKDVFTFSMHQRDLYPGAGEKSSLDLALPPGAGDLEYLKLLRARLPEVFRRSRPDLVIYNAGVDVYKHDLLGGLKLTMAGVSARDELVFGACFKRKVPVAVVLSGGYAAKFSETARLHANTIKAAVRLWRKAGAGKNRRRGKKDENTCCGG
ncbi:MAG: histone deacetylase [Elusimicrobiales bacterium]|jgi:acetoin utilization deacetylase AcuC-like enzyme